MTRSRGIRLMRWLVVGASLSVPADVAAQIDQRALARDIRGDDLTAQWNAAVAAQTLAPSEVGDELRSALLGRLGQLFDLEEQAIRRGEATATVVDPELTLAFVVAVAELRDPGTADLLMRGLGFGNVVIDALASFGGAAVQPVANLVVDRNASSGAVNDGLRTLTRIVAAQGNVQGDLDSEARNLIRSAAHARLADAYGPAMLMAAIDLSMELDDPSLVEMVRALAEDADAVRATGIPDEAGYIELVQRYATKRLGERGRSQP